MENEDSRAGSIFVELASLPATTPLDLGALARLIRRCTRSVQRSVARGELPPPFRLNGKSMWLAGAVIRHLEEKQADALCAARRQDARRRSA